jgi:hypothetical protein
MKSGLSIFVAVDCSSKYADAIQHVENNIVGTVPAILPFPPVLLVRVTHVTFHAYRNLFE